MTDHVSADPEVSWQQQRMLELELNGHALQLGRVLMIGKDGGEKHWGRVKNALRSKNALRPTLYVLPKDPKALIPGREEEGPPQRFVCDKSGHLSVNKKENYIKTMTDHVSVDPEVS